MFAQKRKTLANNLRAAGYETGAIAAALGAAGVAAQARAESLSIEELAETFRAFAGKTGAAKYRHPE